VFGDQDEEAVERQDGRHAALVVRVREKVHEVGWVGHVWNDRAVHDDEDAPEDLDWEGELEKSHPAVTKGPLEAGEGAHNVPDRLLRGELVIPLPVVGVKAGDAKRRGAACEVGVDLCLLLRHFSPLQQVHHSGSEYGEILGFN